MGYKRHDSKKLKPLGNKVEHRDTEPYPSQKQNLGYGGYQTASRNTTPKIAPQSLTEQHRQILQRNKTEDGTTLWNDILLAPLTVQSGTTHPGHGQLKATKKIHEHETESVGATQHDGFKGRRLPR